MIKRFVWPVAVVVVLALGACSGTSKATPAVSVGALVAAYTRYGAGPNDTDVDITYAPAEFYRALGQAVPEDVRSRGAAVFVYNEGVHEGELPPSASVVLRRADGTQVAPTTATVITDGGHHRSTRLAFRLDGATPGSLTLLVLTADGSPAPGGEFTWALPISPTGAPSVESRVGR